MRYFDGSNSKHIKLKVITKKKTPPKKDQKSPPRKDQKKPVSQKSEQQIKSDLLREFYDFILPLSSDSIDSIRDKETKIIDMVNKFISNGKGIIDANMTTVALKLKERAEDSLSQRIKAQTKTKSVSKKKIELGKLQ